MPPNRRSIGFRGPNLPRPPFQPTLHPGNEDPHEIQQELPTLTQHNVEVLPPPHASFRLALAHGSATARTRQADTFIWWPTGLLACFNNETLGPVNARDIESWIQRLMEMPPETKFDVKPTNIEPYNDLAKPIQCRPIKTDIVPMDGTDILSPGDYSISFQDPSKKVIESPTQFFWSFTPPYPTIEFRERMDSMEFGNGNDPTDPVPTHLAENAKQRPQSMGRCVLSGSSGPDTVTKWILPPGQSWAASAFQTRPSDILRDEEGFTHVANLLSMRQDLHRLFFENAFGVDVEDDFKIRIFHPSAKAVGLPARLDISEPDEHTKYFLNEHFHWSLNVYFHGGSTEDDAKLGREPVGWFMDRLSFANDAGVPRKLKLRKEDWETEIGKGILEFERVWDPEFEMTWVDDEGLQDAAQESDN